MRQQWMNVNPQGAVRKKAFIRAMREQNQVLGEQVSALLAQYHNRWVDPRLRRIEWVLFPLRLYDLFRQGVRYAQARFFKPKAQTT